ncbi:DUF6341 family protein [Bergeyella sp. RCAD1439]|uniref:DUF6341 family protein n=1 Tax=Bergeyella anatis TaxID=3113737 RepID=UPI002E18F133|nr:hypothetical protein [Bergeyella sp. RCAD1439]
MTSLWLFLSKVFVWSFGFYDVFGYVLNWILFIVASVLFVYWCWELVVPLGNNKDKDYTSPSKEVRPYYDPEIMKKG